jgi:hypothetical protein
MVDYGRHGSSEQGGGGILGEIRRQMEEMLQGSRPPAPTVVPSGQTTRRGRNVGEGSNTGLAVAAMASYWALPLLVRKKHRRRMKRLREQARAEREAAEQNPDA